MKTLDRYIASTFLKNLLFASVAMTVLFLFQAFFGELLNQEFPIIQLLAYHGLKFPQVFVQMLPPSVLLATVITLSGLNRTQELTACYSLGIGLHRIVGVILTLVFMACCLSLVFQDRILPPFFKKQTTYYWREMKKRKDFFLDLKQDKIWYRSKNLIYNLRSFDASSRTIFGMAVYTFDENFKLLQVVEANRATYTPQGWRLKDGTVTLFTAEDPFPLTQTFQEKELVIKETPKEFQEIEKEIDGLRLKELYKYIERSKSAGANTKSYEVKLHSKISLSFIPLVMSILGVPFSTRRRREGGAAKDFGLCLLITFFYWLFYSIGLSLGTNGALPPWLSAWLPSGIFVVLAAALIARKPT